MYLKCEPITESWVRLAMAFYDPAAVQCSAEYHQSVKSLSSQLKTGFLHEEDIWCTLGHHVHLLERKKNM